MKMAISMLHEALIQNRIGFLFLESSMPLTPASPERMFFAIVQLKNKTPVYQIIIVKMIKVLVMIYGFD